MNDTSSPAPPPQVIDTRVDALLDAPLPEDAWLAFYYVNRGRNPRVNLERRESQSGPAASPLRGRPVRV